MVEDTAKVPLYFIFFHGEGVGCLEGEYHIGLKASACACSLHEHLQENLDDLVQQDILAL